MSVAITAPLSAPASPSATLSSGGTLAIGTPYYYRVIALKRNTASQASITGPYGAEIWGIPCDEVTATPDASNRTITISWSAVTNATGYMVYRTTTSGNYLPTTAHGMQSPTQTRMDLYASTTTTSYVDNGARTIAYLYFFEDGIPLATISGSTEASPDTEDTVYDALVTAGLTAHCVRSGDYGLGKNFVYDIRSIIKIAGGWFKISPNIMLLHTGTITFASGATVNGWTMGEDGTNAPYNGSTYNRSFVYADMYPRSDVTLKFYNSRVMDNSTNYNHFSTTINLYATVFNGTIIAVNSMIDWAIAITGTATGKMVNCICTDALVMQSSAKVYMENVTYCRTIQGIYDFYATENALQKDTKTQGLTYDIWFHKDGNVVFADAVNHQWKSDPPIARATSSPQNLTVRRKYEYAVRVVDQSGNAISGVSMNIKDALGNEINTEVSTSNGDLFIASGTATAGGNNTLTDSGKSWATNQLKDLILEIYEGTGAGQFKSILSNTSTAITVKGNWENNPSTDSKYRIGVLIHTHSYAGKATTPYYDTTTYSPHTIKISKDGYETFTDIISFTAKQISTIELKSAIPVMPTTDSRVVVKLDPSNSGVNRDKCIVI